MLSTQPLFVATCMLFSTSYDRDGQNAKNGNYVAMLGPASVLSVHGIGLCATLLCSILEK